MKFLLLFLLFCGHAFALTLTFDPPPPGAFTIDFETPPALGVNWDTANVYPATHLPEAAAPVPGGSGAFIASNQIGEISGSTSITFPVKLEYAGFHWGSPDTFNTVEFFNAGVSQGSFTGALVPPANGDQGVSPFVSFSGGVFDRIDFSSTQYNFEVDNLTVVPLGGVQLPEPSGTVLAALGGIFCLRRRAR